MSAATTPPAVTALTRPGRQPLPWGQPAHWPAVRDGQAGALRADPAECALQAGDDLAAIQAWLQTKQGRSPHTLEAYRKEVTRLLLWAHDRDQALSDLRLEDLQAYQDFLTNPQPAGRWIGAGRKYALSDPRWRPFAGPLSAASRNQALRALRNLYEFLAATRYLRFNPMAQMVLQTPSVSESGPRHSLSAMQWAAIQAVISEGPQAAVAERQHQARCRWAFTLLYLLGPRLSDLTGTFADIQPYPHGPEGERVWAWYIVGKGGKPVHIPLNDELLMEMGRLREAFGRPPLPCPDDDLPLVPRIRGHVQRPLTRKGLDALVRSVLGQAAQRLHVSGHATESALLARASAHWLRHTAGTELLNISGDLRITAELLRHTDVRTTQRYTHKSLADLLQAISLRSAGW
jgi:site-specific recombinase XerD